MNIATPAEAIAMMWTSSDLIAYHPAFRKSKGNRVKCVGLHSLNLPCEPFDCLAAPFGVASESHD